LAGYNRGSALAPFFPTALNPGESAVWTHTYTELPDNDLNGQGCHVRYSSNDPNSPGSGGLAWSGKLLDTVDPAVVQRAFDTRGLSDQNISGHLQWRSGTAIVSIKVVSTNVWVPIPPNIPTVVKVVRAAHKRKRILLIANTEIAFWDQKRKASTHTDGTID